MWTIPPNFFELSFPPQAPIDHVWQTTAVLLGAQTYKYCYYYYCIVIIGIDVVVIINGARALFYDLFWNTRICFWKSMSAEDPSGFAAL